MLLREIPTRENHRRNCRGRFRHSRWRRRWRSDIQDWLLVRIQGAWRTSRRRRAAKMVGRYRSYSVEIITYLWSRRLPACVSSEFRRGFRWRKSRVLGQDTSGLQREAAGRNEVLEISNFAPRMGPRVSAMMYAPESRFGRDSR